MSNTTLKDIRLSQPKIGMNASLEPPVPTLPHEIHHEEKNTVMTFEIPGIDPETVDIQCENNTLKVSCSRGTSTIPIDPTTDISKITADIKWGLLTVTVPSPVAPPSRSIKVNLHDEAKKTETKTQHRSTNKEFTTA